MKLKIPKISDIKNKVVFVRVDYNVPLKIINGKTTVVNDKRIKSSLETINFLLENNATVVLASHLGRPKIKNSKFELTTKQNSHLSLRHVANYMNENKNTLGIFNQTKVEFINSCTGDKVGEILNENKKLNAEQPNPMGKLYLLENLRFCKGERKNDPKFAKSLAQHMDVYINESFSTSHREHASIVGITNYLPSFAGFILANEVYTFAKMMKKPKRPLVIVLGGAKISDKVDAIKHLAKIADIVLVGGAVANSFLKADGLETHKSYIEEVSSDLKKENINYVDVASSLIEEHKTEKMLIDGYIPVPKILYPIDVIAASSLDEANPEKTVTIDLTKENNDSESIPGIKNQALLYLDIGPKTIKLYREIIAQANTIFWNGPMGVWENPIFSKGSKKIATSIAKAKAKTIIGGGDTISTVNHFGLEKKYDYISAAGGAALALLSGKMLPGIKPILNEEF